MKSVKLPGTDIAVSHIGFGCSSLGGWDDSPLDGERLVQAERMVHAALDCGVSLFDFADIYGRGKAEEGMGRIIRASRGLRDRLVIQTKCGQTIPPAGPWANRSASIFPKRISSAPPKPACGGWASRRLTCFFCTSPTP